MVQLLLEDRFQLKLHHEMRERPVYLLSIAKGGAKLQEVRPDSPDLGGARFNGRPPSYLGEDVPPKGWPLSRMAAHLEGLLNDGRPVIDRTGLVGIYAFNLDYSQDGVDHPPLLPALRDQLGLQLETAKAPVDTVVVDRIERPSGN